MNHDLNIQTMVLGPLDTNCYVLSVPEGSEAIVVDPAGDSDQIIGFLKGRGLHLQSILLTHGHYDHIGAVNDLIDAYNTPVFIHQNDAPMLADPMLNLSFLLSCEFKITKNIQLFNESDIFQLNRCKLTVLHTPGHTPGSSMFIHHDQAIAGDTIFRNSIGRSDFPGSSEEVLLKSIREKVMSLPGRTVLLPGHGMSTSVEHEQHHNPFLKS